MEFISGVRFRYLFVVVLVVMFESCASPKPLEYRNVEHFGLKEAGFTNTVISMDLCLYNPNRYKLQLKQTAVDVYVNDRLLGNVQLQQEYTMPKRDTFLLPVILKIDMANSLGSAFELLKTNFNTSQVKLKLSGSVKAGRHGIFINVPVNYEGMQVIR